MFLGLPWTGISLNLIKTGYWMGFLDKTCKDGVILQIKIYNHWM